MSTELLSSPSSIHTPLPQIDPTDGRGQGAAPSERSRLMLFVPDIHAAPPESAPVTGAGLDHRLASQSHRAPSGLLSTRGSFHEARGNGGRTSISVAQISGQDGRNSSVPAVSAAPMTPSLTQALINRPCHSSSRSR